MKLTASEVEGAVAGVEAERFSSNGWSRRTKTVEAEPMGSSEGLAVLGGRVVQRDVLTAALVRG